MHEIKVKNKKNIKLLNKTVLTSEKFKNSVTKGKRFINNISDRNNDELEDCINSVLDSNRSFFSKAVASLKKTNKNSFLTVKNSLVKINNRVSFIKDKRVDKKNKPKSSSLNVSSFFAQPSTHLKKQLLLKKSIQKIKIRNFSIKDTLKKGFNVFKFSLDSIKFLFSFLIIVGWICFFIIILISLFGLLCSSIFGIFFSSENIDGISMSSVVSELNKEMFEKITNIQATNEYDDYIIESDRAEWKDILIIYSAKISNGINEDEVLTLNESKINELKKIFWDMNEVSFEMKEEPIGYETDSLLENELNKKILKIKITSKSIEEMMDAYFFSSLQRKQVVELMNDEYSDLWNNVIYGTSINSENIDIVQIALSQVGNVGGEPYWSWYGFTSRVGWCACFVSWVANEAGYIDANIFPKFAAVQNGINWFKAVGGWKDSFFIPSPGNIIFFDWENDGTSDHVGIVEKVENGKVYTIEGNSGDACKQKEYDLNSQVIIGYGILNK